MIAEWLFTIFIVSVLISTIFMMLIMIGSSVYDLYAIRETKKPTKISKTRIRRYRPVVSIIIPAFNEELTIVHCLDQLKKLRYRKLDIIVVDDKSQDNTRKLVRRYIRQNARRNIRLAYNPINGGRGAALNRGLKKARGEIIVALDADCEFEPDSIHKLVAHFADPEISAVAGNVRILDDRTVLGLLQTLEYLVSFRTKKFNTITNSEFIIGGAGASYRRDKLDEVGGFDERMKTEDIELSMRMTRLLGKTGGLVYASDYLIHTQAVPSYRALFRQRFRWKFGSLQALAHNRRLLFSLSRKQNPFTGWVRLPLMLWSELLLLIEPFLLGMFLYVAIVAKDPTLFIYAGAVFTFITWLAIFSDEHLKFRTRIKLLLISPYMYITSFIMAAVQVTAALRSILGLRGIFGTKELSGAYTTTQRAPKGQGITS